MRKFKEHLQEKVTNKFGGIYEPNGIKDIKTYENPNINITGMATYDLKNITNLITKKLLELTKEARMLEKDYNKANAKEMLHEIAHELADLDPDNASKYESNADQTIKSIDQMIKDIDTNINKDAKFMKYNSYKSMHSKITENLIYFTGVMADFETQMTTPAMKAKGTKLGSKKYK